MKRRTWLHYIFLVCFLLFIYNISWITYMCFRKKPAKIQITTTTKVENVTQRIPWVSLDKRPIPEWYDEAKIGIFIHWGVFSVPSFGSEWFWWLWKETGQSNIVDFMKTNYRPGFSYADFAPMLTAEFFDPDKWTELIKDAGAKYVILTSKYHDGFCNWDTSASFNWNSAAVGPHRDLIGDLVASIRSRTDLRFGVYYSLYEWFHPLYLQDKVSGFMTQTFVQTKTVPELYEIVNKYMPEVIWTDGDWEAPEEYWTSRVILTWLYNESPVRESVVTNDRWGTGLKSSLGGVSTVDGRYSPGKLVNSKRQKWENVITLDKISRSFRRNAQLSDFITIEELLTELVSTVSYGGNFIVTVGPSKEGHIHPIYEERLRQMGGWLQINGEAIYKSKPWIHQNDTVTKNVWYTYGYGNVYALVTKWPKGGILFLGAPRVTDKTKVFLLGSREPLRYDRERNGIIVHLRFERHLKWAWILKITDLPA